MYTWVARDKASEWRVIDSMAAHGLPSCGLLIEAVCEHLIATRDRPAKTPGQMLRALASHLASVAGGGDVWIDLGNLAIRYSDADVAEMIRTLRESMGPAASDITPLIRTSAGPAERTAVLEWAHAGTSGMAIRVYGVTSLAEKSLIVNALVKESRFGSNELDLITDAQDLPSLTSIHDLAEAFPLSQSCRRWVTLAGSFPPSVTHLSPDEYEHVIERREWTHYVNDIEATDVPRLPSFGDFATQSARYAVSPAFRASPTVRYTLADRFLVLRGRLNMPDASQQYVGHARYLQSLAEFAEIVHTPGDEYITKMATGLHRTGNGTTWRIASLSRHVQVASAQVAAFEGAHAQVR